MGAVWCENDKQKERREKNSERKGKENLSGHEDGLRVVLRYCIREKSKNERKKKTTEIKREQNII